MGFGRTGTRRGQRRAGGALGDGMRGKRLKGGGGVGGAGGGKKGGDVDKIPQYLNWGLRSFSRYRALGTND